MATFDEFYRSLREDGNKRGEYFEKVFIPWFLKKDPVWSTKVNQIWLWDDYPQRWGRDCGIDLVYEDLEGKHWAIQSKCVSPDREISKAEIDSFLSESSDSRIHGRLLIASTDGIGKNAQQVIDRQEKQVVCFLLEHFRQSEIDFPSSPEDLSTGQRKEKRPPRPHQLEAITNVLEGLQKEDRGQLLMACGTGKTLTSLWINEALKAKRTLVLLPSLSLLSQTLREWTATSQEKFNWICVCSDNQSQSRTRPLTA
jgi:predicted helicase